MGGGGEMHGGSWGARSGRAMNFRGVRWGLMSEAGVVEGQRRVGVQERKWGVQDQVNTSRFVHQLLKPTLKKKGNAENCIFKRRK